MPIQLWNEKCFSVKCDKCNIEETMMFKSKLSPRGGRTGRYWRKPASKVPLFYKHIPLTTIDKNGNEAENYFTPIKTILGDQLPKNCPICGEKLNISEMFIIH